MLAFVMQITTPSLLLGHSILKLYFQEARKWATGHSKNESLDYSEKSDGVRGASDGDSGAESINMQQKSLVDMDEDIDSEDSEEVGAHDHTKCLQVHPQETDRLTTDS